MIKRKQEYIVEIGVFDLLLAIAQRKRMIVRLTLLTAIAVTIICFTMPLKWESRALISPIADNTAGIQLNTEFLNSLGEMPLLGSQKMEMAIDFITVVDSRTFREGVIHQFNIIDYLRITKPDSLVAMEIALKKLNANILDIELKQSDNTIQITVLTKDKYLSQKIVEYVIQTLDYYIRYQKQIKSKITREFLEQRTSAIKTQLDTLLILSRNFESKGKAISIDEQTTATLDLYSELVSQKIMNDIDLEIAKQQYGKSSPKIEELETKSQLLTAKINDFENNLSGNLPKYLLQLQDLPEANMQYSKIQLDIKIMNQVYEYLYPIMEAARLTELKDMPAIEIVDRPSLAGMHTYPKRLLLVVMVTLAALLLGCILAILDAFIPLEQKRYFSDILIELVSFKKRQSPKSNQSQPEE